VIRALALLVLVALGGAAAAVFLDLRRPGAPLPAPATVTIAQGERFADIAADLHRQGVLRHPWPLVAWARVTRRYRAVH